MIDDNTRKDILLHYGMPRRSGRYPWGSGRDPQRSRDFISASDEIKARLVKEGVPKNKLGTLIAREMGMSTTEYRQRNTLADEERARAIYSEVKTRMDRGESVANIASDMNISKNSVRNYAVKDPNEVAKGKQINGTMDALRNAVERSEYVDVGKGVERQIGISKEKLGAAVEKLKAEGYYKYSVKVDQLTSPTNRTNMVILSKDPDFGNVMKNIHKVRAVDFVAVDGDAMTLQNIQKPESLSWDRVKIRYAIPEGQKGHGTADDGEMMDGSMTIRPSAADLQFGANKHYAQVRINVGGTHYLKGVALYGKEEDFPPGVDVIFNTNKGKNKSPEQVLKPLKVDKLTGEINEANPFGATIKRQNAMTDGDGNIVPYKLNGKIQLDKKGNPIAKAGALNIVNEEGDWADWSKSVSAQFLSKQPRPVVKERIDATVKKVLNDYDEIARVNNPTIKKQLLESYASDLESKQVHLKTVAPKGFQGHLILPITNMKENEVYAPNYKDGEKVILVRYPHGGRFEIPELTVNNKGPGKDIIGPKSPDAIGIHPKVGRKLSGADFDGDTVYVIPNNQGKYKSRSALKDLENFDPNIYEDKAGTFVPITKSNKQKQMGIVSNLITDMSLQGASDSELTRAVRHSMVVIDSEKHKLNYLRSEKDNGIDALKKKYQIHIDRVDYKNLKMDDPTRFETITRADGTKTAKRDANGNKVHKKITPIDEEELKTLGDHKVKTGAATVISRHKQEVTTGGTKMTYQKEIKPGQPGNMRNLNALKRKLKNGEITDAEYKNQLTNLPSIYKEKTGINRRTKSYLVNMLDDASVLLNPNSTQVEKDYVDYINKLKSKHKEVMTEIQNIKPSKRDPKAAKIYANEVKSLDKKLALSELNAPRERQAQTLASYNFKKELARLGGSDALDKDDIKKLKTQAVAGARAAVGASRHPVKIEDHEWEAIQANAISPDMLSRLVRHMDDDQLKELATPRKVQTISTARKSRVAMMLNNGNYTIAQIAQATGMSTSAVSAIKAEHGITTSRDRLAASSLPSRPQDYLFGIEGEE